MSLFILDTDTLTLLNWNHPKVLQHCAIHSNDEIAVSVISVEEQLSGWHRALRKVKRTAQLATIYDRMTETVRTLRAFSIFSFGQRAIQHYDTLLALKLGVKKMYLRIAAIALQQGAVVVTRNQIDFQRIPGLFIEDWSQ